MDSERKQTLNSAHSQQLQSSKSARPLSKVAQRPSPHLQVKQQSSTRSFVSLEQATILLLQSTCMEELTAFSRRCYHDSASQLNGRSARQEKSLNSTLMTRRKWSSSKLLGTHDVAFLTFRTWEILRMRTMFPS